MVNFYKIFCLIFFGFICVAEVAYGATKGNTATSSQLFYHDLVPLSVVISEILPNPKNGQQEFVEFQNLENEPAKVSDLNLKIGERTYKLKNPDTIPAGGFFVLDQAHLPASLRNSGRVVELLDTQNRTLSSISYINAPASKSWSREKSGEFFWTEKVTMGKPNIFQDKVLPEAKKEEVFQPEKQNNTEAAKEDKNIAGITSEQNQNNNLIPAANRSKKNFEILKLTGATVVVVLLGLLASKKLL